MHELSPWRHLSCKSLHEDVLEMWSVSIIYPSLYKQGHKAILFQHITALSKYSMEVVLVDKAIPWPPCFIKVYQHSIAKKHILILVQSRASLQKKLLRRSP